MAEMKSMSLAEVLGLLGGQPSTQTVQGEKCVALTMDGQGDVASFKAALETNLDKAVESARREGLTTIQLCIHGDVKVPSEASGTKPPIMPTTRAIFEAMLAGRFKPITEYSGFMGIEGQGFIWDAPDFSVVMDLSDDGYRLEVIDGDGNTTAMSPRAVNVQDAIGTLETIRHQK